MFLIQCLAASAHRHTVPLSESRLAGVCQPGDAGHAGKTTLEFPVCPTRRQTITAKASGSDESATFSRPCRARLPRCVTSVDAWGPNLAKDQKSIHSNADTFEYTQFGLRVPARITPRGGGGGVRRTHWLVSECRRRRSKF